MFLIIFYWCVVDNNLHICVVQNPLIMKKSRNNLSLIFATERNTSYHILSYSIVPSVTKNIIMYVNILI